MTSRERLLCVLNGGIPDRLPFAPLINSYFLDSLPPGEEKSDPVDFLKSVGCDVADRWVGSYQCFGIDDPMILKNGHIKKDIIGEENRIITIFKTPFGELTKVMSKRPEAGNTWFHDKYLVEKKEDIKAYQYLWECFEAVPNYNLTLDRINYIGEDGIIMVTVPTTPLLQMIMYDLGLERTVFFLEDYSKDMNHLMEIMITKSLQACRIAALSPAMVSIIPENTGTRLIMPRMFDTYCVPLLKEYARIHKDSKKILLLHACGHLKDLLTQIAGIGLCGVESLTPPPTGNVELEHAMKILGEDMTIFGGLDPVWFLNASPEEIEIRIKSIVDVVQPGRHFILMPSDSTPSGVPLANFTAVLMAIKKYGVFSDAN